MQPIWEALYAAGVDAVLAGHDHNYERFAQQTPSGALDTTNGIREFVVGTGGRYLRPIGTIKPNSEVRNATTYGVLKLTLHPTSYDWNFVPVAGQSFTDSGSGQCHGALGDADTVAPAVSVVAPTGGTTDVAVTANAEATFSEAMDPNTISASTVTLTKQGSTHPIAAAVSYDGPTKKAKLDPSAELEAGATYTATVKGGAMGVKDLAGNPLGADKTWSFGTAALPLSPPVDITAPETAIDSGPSGTVSSTSASFAFSSSEASSTFECSLDGGPFEACASPKSYAGLAEGAHTFQVRATDAAGSTDPTPASRSWTVNTTVAQSISSGADTKLAQRATSTNYGGAATLQADGDEPAGSGKDTSALVRWNLSAIPAGSKVRSASVTLNVTNTSTETYEAYELRRPWVQTAATWLLYAASRPWEIAGANGSLDRAAQPAGTVTPSAKGKLTFALSPALVQGWLDNPATNNGIVIADTVNTDGFDFSSRESSTSGVRPQLNVTYAAP
jgi:hypothetical protein